MENTISLIFRLLASAVSLYGTICFIRIIITWIPSINYSSIGSFLSQLCDPYLYIFARFPLRVGMLDFTPVISLGLLTLVSSILNDIARSGKIYIGGILAGILSLVWSVGSTFVGIMMLLFFIRYCVAIFVKSSNEYGSPWQVLDNSISRLVYKIA
ncbi:MAG: YggT family protein, partial [Spirochaetia bacterium]|nr:YggT family protein [Spirochaetia bacterium]